MLKYKIPQIVTLTRNHYERILNYFVNRSTNAAAEAFNAKIKAFRASFRGVVDKRFFLYRLAKVYA
ncbi:transposase [Phocaeicola vulgatus]|nr:transposase [Phocaeicola vulgatus]QQY41966.1 transposase [Phocaeicola vulgatus]